MEPGVEGWGRVMEPGVTGWGRQNPGGMWAHDVFTSLKNKQLAKKQPRTQIAGVATGMFHGASKGIIGTNGIITNGFHA